MTLQVNARNNTKQLCWLWHNNRKTVTLLQLQNSVWQPLKDQNELHKVQYDNNTVGNSSSSAEYTTWNGPRLLNASSR